MKWSTIALLFLVLQFRLFGADKPTLWGNPVNGFSVGLFFSNSVSSVDQPLLATVSIRNDSDAQQWLTISPVEVLTSFIVTDERRQQVESKPPPNMENIRGFRSVPLSPGAVWSSTTDLHDFLILTNSGEFTVTAKRMLGRDVFALSENFFLRLIAKENGGATVVPDQGAAPGQTFPVTDDSQTAAAIKHTTEMSKSGTATSRPLATAVAPSATGSFSHAQEVAAAIIAALVVLLLAILWRAVRRKPEA